MALSPSSGFIVPEVFASAIMSGFTGNAVMRQFATIFSELEGNPGDKLNLVAFSQLTDLAANAAETTALVPEALTSAQTQMTLVEAAKAVTLTDRSVLTAFGDTVGEAANQIAAVIQRKVDADLRDAIYAAATAASRSITATAGITYDEVVDALSLFGDTANNGNVALVIHSAQFRQLLKDTKFEHGTADGQTPGFCGVLNGLIPCYLSDRITTVEGTPDTYKAILIQGKPLAFAQSKAPAVEHERSLLDRTTTVMGSLLYCGGVMNSAKIGVLVTE